MDENIAIVLLAAGEASRMGVPKQLLDWNGAPLIRHAAETALASGAGRVVVVTGAHGEPVSKSLGGLAVAVAANPLWSSGMGSSIQAGIAALPESTSAVILALADQPLITAEFYRSLADKHRESGKPIVAAEYAGTAGVPVLFARSHFRHLLALAPNQGCKSVIMGNKPDVLLVPCPEAEADVDTMEDYDRLRGAKTA